jgi:hypothetical protein
MFDLEMNIRSWGDCLRSHGTLEEEDTLELEGHLRDQVNDLAKSGLSEEEAFIISVKRMGNLSTISEEYAKIHTENMWKHLLLDPEHPAAVGSKRDILMVILFALLAGTAVRIPALFGIEIVSIPFFKNLSLHILPFVALFLAHKHGTPSRLRWILAGVFGVSLVIVNIYPSYEPWHTETLSAIHPPIMLWLVTGVASADARLDGFDDVYGDDLSINQCRCGAVCGELPPHLWRRHSSMLTVYLVEAKKSIVENFATVSRVCG